MKKEKWFWILGLFLFLLFSATVVFESVDKAGFYSEIMPLFVIKESLKVFIFLSLILFILVLIKSVVSKFFLKKYKLNFWNLFKSLLIVSLIDLSLCSILIWWFVGVFFSKSGQDTVRLLGLLLYLVLEFFLIRKFLIGSTKKNNVGLIWNLKIFGIIAVSHLLFFLVVIN